MQSKFSNDWIQTTDLWCLKQPLCQLSHNHRLEKNIVVENTRLWMLCKTFVPITKSLLILYLETCLHNGPLFHELSNAVFLIPTFHCPYDNPTEPKSRISNGTCLKIWQFSSHYDSGVWNFDRIAFKRLATGQSIICLQIGILAVRTKRLEDNSVMELFS